MQNLLRKILAGENQTKLNADIDYQREYESLIKENEWLRMSLANKDAMINKLKDIIEELRTIKKQP